MGGDELIPINQDGRAAAEEEQEPADPMKMLKLKYGALTLLVFLLALLFRWVPQANYIFREIPATTAWCAEAPLIETNVCIGFTVTLRLSFALCVFYALHLCLGCRLAQKCFGPAVFDMVVGGFFVGRLLLFAAIFTGTLFMDHTILESYAVAARFLSLGFLAIQSILLLDFVCDLNDCLVPRDGYLSETPEEEARKKRWAVAVTLGAYIVAIVVVSLSYAAFTPSSCGGQELVLHQFFITFTVVFGVLSTLFAMWAQRGAGASILVSGVVFAYCAIMTWSAMSSGADDAACFTLWSDPTKINASTVISLVIACFAVVYSGTTAGANRQALMLRDLDTAEPTFGFFFLNMALGACYLAMALCSWSVDITDTDTVRAESSEESMWIKMSTVWFTMFLVATAQVAPYLCGEGGFCCTDRTFD